MEIQLSDLWQDCPNCGGRGVNMVPVAEGSAQRRPEPCKVCKERGGSPTASGEAVLKFLNRVNITR